MEGLLAMAEWKKTIEEGLEFWVNDEVGSIMKTNEDKYLVLLPRVVQIGPFDTLGQAQDLLGEHMDEIDKALNCATVGLIKR